MKETTFYVVLVAGAAAAFYYDIPQEFLAEFADWFRNVGSSISYR